MGLFFGSPEPQEELVNLFRTAVETDQVPPAQAEERARTHAAQYQPLFELLRADFGSPALHGEAAQERARAAARAASRGLAAARPPFYWGRFLGALAIFAALVAGGIVTDVLNHAASAGALFGFAGTVFGVVAAFLGVEKPS